jgi:GT2 family glycosyltransferase
MHRSGTTVISGALERCGFHASIEAGAMSTGFKNARGFQEHHDVVSINEKLLSEAGSTWFQPAPVAKQKIPEIQELIAALDRRSPWVISDPRLAFTWPAWDSVLGSAAKLFVYRSPLAVATSLNKSYGFPLEFGLDLWEMYNCQAMKVMSAQGATLVHYDAFYHDQNGTWEQLQKRLSGIGVAIDLSSVATEYNQQLDHSAAMQGDERRLTAGQKKLHGIFLQACESGKFPQRLPTQRSNLAQKVHEFGQAFCSLAEVAGPRSALVRINSERDKTTEHFKAEHAECDALSVINGKEYAGEARLPVPSNLASEHAELQNTNASLAAARRKLADSLKALEAIEQQLSRRDKQLAKSQEAERQLEAKADYLFGILDTAYLKLLAYRKSPAGRFSAAAVTLYKLLTLRPHLKTDFESILDDASEHVKKYRSPSLLAGRSRLDLFFTVVSYWIRNPAISIRDSSFSSIKRAIAVFLGRNRGDMELWIQTKFPVIGDSAMSGFKLELSPALDTLELGFFKSEKPRVSIVIPVYNEYRMTIFCLQSLLGMTSDVEYEVILADDASSDLTSTIGERILGIEIVRAEQNLGFLNNCRNGASHARGEYVLFLNNDTAFTEGWLSNLIDVLDNDPRAGIVGPMLIFGSGRLQEAGGIIWQDASGWNFGRTDDPASPEYNYVKETDYVSGACLLIRRGLWEELGGFDQRFAPAYYEDTDLCFAVRAAGYKVVYQPAARIYHYEGISHGTDLNSGVKKHQVENKKKFLDKWASTLQLENFANAQRVFLARDRSRNRRTVLVIDHYVPMYDMDAGSRSTWQYLELMVEMGYNVKFLGANFFPHQPYTQQLQSMGVEVLVGEKMARNCATWLNENAQYIDTIYVHRPHIAEDFLSRLREMSPRPKMVYFGHDLHFLREQREYAVTGDDKHRVAAEDWKKRELAVFKDFDKIYYPSQVEIDLLAEIAPEVDASAIPLYLMEQSELPPYKWLDRADILFVGGFNHSPNVDAIFWFVEEILPLVVAACPDIKLNVVGSKAPDSIQALASKHVVIHGYLTDEELAEQYRRTRVVAVPLRFGAGVKGKVLEALQRGVPIVTTGIGAEGLPEAGLVMNVKETAADFAQELIEIERGCSERLGKLNHYSKYLNQYFSKSRASEILCRDFGEPQIDREWL